METFFRAGDYACAIYCRTRDKTDKYNSRGREFMEAIWRDVGKFLDPDLVQRAGLYMPAVFWELYVAHTLKRHGIELKRQARTSRNKKGPDLLTGDPDVWIEAVVAGMGTGPDAMEYPPMGVAYDTPVRPFILRLRNAIETKAAVLMGYIQDGLIIPGQATVIAVSGALLPTAIGEGPIPRIVQATLGVGKPVELVERALVNSSKAGDIVADLFGGSGSTLIGCERRGRKARLMEIDPKYADCIVHRWQEYTGKQAVLEGDGRPFEEIGAERGKVAA